MMVNTLLGVVSPLLPRLAHAEHSTFFASLVYGGHPIGSLLAAIPAVLAARKWGLPRVIVSGAGLMAAATVLFVYPGHGYWFVLARIGHGFAATIIWQSVFGWLLSNVGPSHRATATGTLLAAATTGSLIGPQLGAASTVTGRWIFLFPAVILVVCSTYFLRMPPYDFAERSTVRHIVRAFNSRVGWAAVGLSAAVSLASVGFATQAPLLLGRLGLHPFGIGATLTLGPALMVLANPVAGRLFDLGHRRLLLSLSFGLAAITLLCLTTVHAQLLAAGLCLSTTVN
jgi:MFS family permease